MSSWWCWSRCMKMAPSKFDVFMIFTNHLINANCPNFNKRPCQMAPRWRWDNLVAGFQMLANLIHNNDNKLLKPLKNFHNENCIMYHAKKAGVAQRTQLPDSLCKTRLWPYNDKLDYMNNYPDTSPKQHQSVQLESVKVKLFQCFSCVMYRDNSCNGLCIGGE